MAATIKQREEQAVQRIAQAKQAPYKMLGIRLLSWQGCDKLIAEKMDKSVQEVS